MGLQRFERRLERLVEGGFGKAFRSGLQPVEIGRRLVREMDIGRTLGVRGTVAPNEFTIRIAEADLERFDGFRESLLNELADTAREHARESKYHFVGPVSVEFAVGPNALSDSQASRHHAEVRRTDAGFVIVDLDSLNGTTVNGVVVHEKTLEDGDVITIGETAIRYEES
jgi:hypothetical protein